MRLLSTASIALAVASAATARRLPPWVGRPHIQQSVTRRDVPASQITPTPTTASTSTHMPCVVTFAPNESAVFISCALTTLQTLPAGRTPINLHNKEHNAAALETTQSGGAYEFLHLSANIDVDFVKSRATALPAGTITVTVHDTAGASPSPDTPPTTTYAAPVSATVLTESAPAEPTPTDADGLDNMLPPASWTILVPEATDTPFAWTVSEPASDANAQGSGQAPPTAPVAPAPAATLSVDSTTDTPEAASEASSTASATEPPATTPASPTTDTEDTPSSPATAPAATPAAPPADTAAPAANTATYDSGVATSTHQYPPRMEKPAETSLCEVREKLGIPLGCATKRAS